MFRWDHQNKVLTNILFSFMTQCFSFIHKWQSVFLLLYGRGRFYGFLKIV